MKIAVYMSDFIYKYGGAEGYAANLIEVLQRIFPHKSITVLTESYKFEGIISETQFVDNQNKAYGLNINSELIRLRYIPSVKIGVNEDSNKVFRIMQFLKRQKSNFRKQSAISKITKEYDLFINCSAFWEFYGQAKKNIIIIHFPKEKLLTIPINNKLPFCKALAKKQDCNFTNNTDLFIPNSEFTSYWLTQKWQISDDKKCVLYPPVNLYMRPQRKNIIRFLFAQGLKRQRKSTCF